MVFAQVEEGNSSVLEANSHNIDEWWCHYYFDPQIVLGEDAAEEGEGVYNLACEYIDQAEGLFGEGNYLVDVGNWVHYSWYLEGELILFDLVGLFVDEDDAVSFAEDYDSLEFEEGTWLLPSFYGPLVDYVMVAKLQYLTRYTDVGVLVKGDCGDYGGGEGWGGDFDA